MSSKSNQLKIGIVLNYLNMGLGNLIPIFYTPVMLALLGTEEYGLYKLSSSVTSYLSLISLGIGSAITRYLIKAKSEEGKEGEERIFGLFIWIFRIISVIAIVAGIILTINLNLWYADSFTSNQLLRMRILVLLMTCNMALGFSTSPYSSVVTAHEKFIFLQCVNIISTCIGPILNLLVLALGYSSIGMAISSLAINIVIRFVDIVYVQKCMGLTPRYSKLNPHLLKEIFLFSFWVFISNISTQLCNTTDIAMIGAIPTLAATGVAVYNIGATFNTIVVSLATGVSSLLTPRANKMVFSGANKNDLTDVSIKVGRIQAYIIALVLSGFIAFGRPFIQFYAGRGFEEAYWVAIFMMVPNAVPLVQSMCLSIITAENKHRFRSIVYLLINLTNVIGTWILLQIWGITGASFMTGLSLILGNGFIMNWYYNYRIGLNIGKFWSQVSKIFLIPIIMAAVVIILGKIINWYNIATMICGILLYTIIFFILNWMFIANTYEKKLVFDSFKYMYCGIRNFFKR